MTVFWIHGWSANTAMWCPLREVRALYTNVDADLRSVADVGDFLRGLAEQAPSEPFVAVGWSLGGALALDLAARSSIPCAGVVAIGANPCFCRPPPRGWPARVVARMKRQLRRQPRDVTRAFQERLFTDEEVGAGHLTAWRQALATGAPGFTEAGLLAGLDYLQTRDLHATVASLNCPVRWIRGAADTICPAGAFADLPPAADVHLVPTCGHAPVQTRPDVVAALIREFVDAL